MTPVRPRQSSPPLPWWPENQAFARHGEHLRAGDLVQRPAVKLDPPDPEAPQSRHDRRLTAARYPFGRAVIQAPRPRVFPGRTCFLRRLDDSTARAERLPANPESAPTRPNPPALQRSARVRPPPPDPGPPINQLTVACASSQSAAQSPKSTKRHRLSFPVPF